MQRKFLSNLSLLLILNLLIKPLYILGIDAEIQNRVGTDEYGHYFALINLSFLFNILIDFGINHFNNRNIAQNEELLGKHFSKLFSLKALLALIYAAVTLAFGYALGYFETSLTMLSLLVLNQIFVSFIAFIRSNLTALQLFSRDSIISILDRLLLIFLCGILLYTNITGGEFKIEWFVYLQTFAYGVTLLVSILLIGKHIGRFKWGVQKSFALMIARKSIPYALFILIGALYNRIDGLMLDNMLINGNTEAGIYAQGFRYYEAAGMFAILFPVLLLPLFAKMLKNNESVKPLMQIATRLLVGGGVLLAVYFWYWSGPVLGWIYDDVSLESERSFSWLMIGFAGLCMFYTYGTLLTANADLKIMNVISLISLGINLVLNYFLIPLYGSVGAAFATMCTQCFVGGAQFIISTKKFQLGIDIHLMIQLGIFILGFGYINYLIQSKVDDATTGALISIGIGTVLYSLFSGAMRPKQIIALFKPKE